MVFSLIHSEGEDGIWDQVSRIYTRTNATSYQVTGLTPFTVYSFRLLAVNKLGVSPPSKESYYIVTLREGEPNEIYVYTHIYIYRYMGIARFMLGTYRYINSESHKLPDSADMTLFLFTIALIFHLHFMAWRGAARRTGLAPALSAGP